jgi:aspartyl-tRNA(Asn)/glutamyl-tRNA(Gln) amidotransferase subunit A
MTRTVADNALMLGVLAGHDPLDPASVQPPESCDYVKTLEHGVRGLRIGFVRHFHETDMPADPEVAAGLDRVALTLRSEGADIIDVTLPALEDFSAVNRVILQSEAWSIHSEWLRNRPGGYGRLARRRLMSGAFIGAGDYVLASRQRSQMIGDVETALRKVDVLLCASSMDPPCRIDEPEEIERTYMRQARAPFNVTGHPALAMPAGLSRDGLPLSVQFVGRYFDEANLFRVARAWERAAGTDALHPSLAG